MKKNNLDSEGTFLSISENYPIINALRSYLNIDQKFPNLTFSTKKSDFEEKTNNNIEIFPESLILNELNEKIVQNPKGNKSFLWIKPRPGITRGVLSDTFLDLVVLAYIPNKIKEFLIPKRKSKYYLIGGWKPKSQTQYCEPLMVHQDETKKESLENKLIQPLVHFRNSENKLDKIRLDYFILLVFLEHHISEGFKFLDNGRRIEKSILDDWGYIQIKNDEIILTEKTKEILMLIQNVFFLEWWRSFFINEKINAEVVKKQMSRLSTCPKEIILRAYLDSITYKHRISFKKSLSEISKFVQIEKNTIVHLIKNWLIGEYYGQECIEGDNFIYPPQKIDRFWANWTVIQNRFHKGLPFFGRKEELDQLNLLKEQ